jgi:cobalt-zinc-cadmium efflux system protein
MEHDGYAHDANHEHDHAHQQPMIAVHDGHAHPTDRVNRRPLVIAFAITFTFFIAEVIGGMLTNSLALLADAGHMATDVAALGLALWAIWLARKSATTRRSFGYLRAEVVAAFVNAATLIAISFYILYEAFERIGAPPDIGSGPMLVVAIVGFLANAASAWVLMHGGGHDQNLNTRGAFLHVISGMLGSVGAIAAAIIMLLTGWYVADPILSAGIGLLILFSSWRLLRESLDVLLEATPKHVPTDEVRNAMLTVDGVSNVHDLHVWTITSGLVALSGHVEKAGTRPWNEVLHDLTTLVSERYGIAHTTLQPETVDMHAEAFHGCSLDAEHGHAACQTPA